MSKVEFKTPTVSSEARVEELLEVQGLNNRLEPGEKSPFPGIPHFIVAALLSARNVAERKANTEAFLDGVETSFMFLEMGLKKWNVRHNPLYIFEKKLRSLREAHEKAVKKLLETKNSLIVSQQKTIADKNEKIKHYKNLLQGKGIVPLTITAANKATHPPVDESEELKLLRKENQTLRNHEQQLLKANAAYKNELYDLRNNFKETVEEKAQERLLTTTAEWRKKQKGLDELEKDLARITTENGMLRKIIDGHAEELNGSEKAELLKFQLYQKHRTVLEVAQERFLYHIYRLLNQDLTDLGNAVRTQPALKPYLKKWKAVAGSCREVLEITGHAPADPILYVDMEHVNKIREE